MKFCIDTDEIRVRGVPVDVLAYLLAMYLGTPIKEDTASIAHKLGYVGQFEVNPARYELDKQGVELIEELFLNTEIGGNNSAPGRFERLADKLRELYPEGRKPGTNYMWRDSTRIIAKKLKTLVKKYGDCFTDEQAIDATRRYIESFNGNYDYMQLLKYFISKKKVIDGEIEETSQLLSFIENKDNDSTNTEWALELK